jgi:hypothetical protein
MGTEGVRALLDKIKRTTTPKVAGIESLGLKSNSSETSLPKVTATKNFLAYTDSLMSRAQPLTPPGRGRGGLPSACPTSRVTRTWSR